MQPSWDVSSASILLLQLNPVPLHHLPILGFATGCCEASLILIVQKFGARDYSEMRCVANSLYSLFCRSSYHHLQALSVQIFSVGCERLVYLPWCIPLSSRHRMAFLHLLYNPSGIIRALGDSKRRSGSCFFHCSQHHSRSGLHSRFPDGAFGRSSCNGLFQSVSAVLCYLYMIKHFPILRSTSDERRYESCYVKTLMEHWCTDGTVVFHYGHRQHHASECKQCFGYKVVWQLYRCHAYQDVLHDAV